MSISADSASLVCKKETVVVMLDTRDLLMDTFKVDTGMLYNLNISSQLAQVSLSTAFIILPKMRKSSLYQDLHL